MSETVSLETEPFAAAMNALAPMPEEPRRLVGERLLALADARRHEILDFSFGDKEVVWSSTGDASNRAERLAVSYDGYGKPSVTILDLAGDPLAEWEGEDAWPLLSLGRLAGRERNDETAELTPLDKRELSERAH
jgi:hypothetical protein